MHVEKEVYTVHHNMKRSSSICFYDASLLNLTAEGTCWRLDSKTQRLKSLEEEERQKTSVSVQPKPANFPFSALLTWMEKRSSAKMFLVVKW